MTGTWSPYTPILVGIGSATQREDDPAQAAEPINLMIDAVRAAGTDLGNDQALQDLETIAVPRGRWSYRNPASDVAKAVGATSASTIVSSVGVLQQTLIANACEQIAAGEISMALVTGADAGHRILQSRINGVDLSERQQDDEPDIELAPAAELRHAAELAAGLSMPVGLYAILDSARRAAAGVSISQHRARMASTYARFSEIAASNPHAWDRVARTAREIRNPDARNPMQAFPYARSHCSAWNVDQAAALILCSAAKAEALDIDPARWIFPIVSAESNHMVPVSARKELAQCHGAEEAVRAALESAGYKASEIDLFELYSCFPVAVEAFADCLGLTPEQDRTVTGSMAFAGGPYNNYYLQAVCRVAELLREGPARTALMSCVSGVLTKQSVAIWSSSPPDQEFVRIDVSDRVASAVVTVDVALTYSGAAHVAGSTVVHCRGQAPQVVALVDTGTGRAIATSESEEFVESFQRDEWVGRAVRIQNNEIMA